ncbi:MAG: hypothetical protein ACEQSR_06545 [Candidatus Methylacidiphilales bacterium]
MKKTIKSLFVAGFAIALTVTSCKKDETTTTTPTGTSPTVSITDSTGTNKVDTNNFFVFSYMKIAVTPASGTTIDSMKLEIAIDGQTLGNSPFSATDSSQKKGFTESINVAEIINLIGETVTSKITFTATAKDNKGLTGTSTITYNIVNDKAVIVSKEIELGAQTNTAIPYKFLGITNSFATYTSGETGTARLNSGNIDFVYYYGDGDKNAFAAPNNMDGAKIVWNAEINTWARQNATKFKTTSVTATQFDNIASTTKVDDLFASETFTTGTTEKVTSIAVGNVYAFQTASGVKGLAKFTAISADKTGSTKVILIIQN